MSRIIILSPYEIKKFDNAPLFNDEERYKFFNISASIKVKLNNLNANDSKVGFVLQLGYLKATGKFYHKYNDNDKLFVSQLLGINLTGLNNYTERIRLNHKSEILAMLNYKPFNKNKDLFEEHIENLVSKQIHPRKIIFAMVDLLRARKIEVPNYDKFVRSITTNINKYENNLVLKVADNITDDNKSTLDSLLESDDSKSMITKLKVINQSVMPSRIKQSISGFILIKKLYEDNAKLIKLLDLSREATKYYASWVIKAKISQIKTISDNTRYLYLLAFLDHQYKSWQDIFIDTILKVNQQYLNKIEILAKESKNDLADRNNHLLDFVLRDFDKQSEIIDQVRNIIYDEKIDNSNKVNKLKIIVSKEMKKNHDNSKIDELKQNLICYKQQEKQNFVILNKLSRALQNRLADIIKHIEFIATDEVLNEAILYYQNNNLTKSAPNSFLEKSEVEAVYNNGFNSNLYKILLFMKIAEAIKSGEISLTSSYRYMSIESYLIKEEIWHAQKEELLRKLDLQEFMDIEKVLKKLRTELDYKYRAVNK
ncbi:MAG: DUF4158 domain-containing protein, partial [Rickettsia aeschlimannii]